VTAEAVTDESRGPGRPPCCSRELAECVIRMRLQGLTYGQILIALNAKRIPKPMGGMSWQKSDVARLLRTRHARELCDEMRSQDGR